MPAATTLSRIGKHEYFAILGSGTYVVGSWGLLFASYWSYHHNLTAWQCFRQLSGIIQGHWPVAVAILYLAFLVGSVLRAIRVNPMDNFCDKWRKLLLDKLFTQKNELAEEKKQEVKKESAEQKKSDKNHDQDSFPYHRKLKKVLAVLKARLGGEMVGLDSMVDSGDSTHALFHFWKAELCREVLPAFEYAQELEGRVRLFATMVWAGALGILAGIIGVAFWASCLHGFAWGFIIFSLLVGSAFVFLVFGSQLRHIRDQEATTVFIAYVALNLERSREKAHPEK